jgi:two-component system chemotaxis response regulator CheB
MKIKVLVVDASASMRLMLADIVNTTPDMKAVALAGDEAQAALAVKEKNPDVIIVDAEMPGFKGSSFLTELIRTPSIPVLILSDAAARNSKAVLQLLEQEASDFVIRPRTLPAGSERVAADQIRERLRSLHLARASQGAATDVRKVTAFSNAVINDKVILIGASTGGTEAIREVLAPLPAEMPPILIVQHMPELFTTSFAKRLDHLSRLKVKEAEDGEPIKPGTAYLAPGHSHLSLKKSVNGLLCELSDGPPVNRHRPSVDALFLSAAKVLGPRALGILLTGMGKDGAQGMLAMRQAGAWTVAQDQDSCVVWGMPREAMMIGGAQEVAPLNRIADLLLARLRQGDRRAA